VRKPQVFYKYKSLDNFEFLFDLIIKERLYAASHNELNDPMEGAVKIDGTIPREKELEWDELIKQYRIVCFSRDKDSSLMWSHYADGGRGCLIEFQLLEGQDVHRVSYLKKPSITEKHISQDKAAEILMHKEKPWKYEAESRCLLGINDRFLPITIQSVTFGCRAEKSKVDMLLHILELCKPNLKILIKKDLGLINAIPYVSTQRTFFGGSRVRTPDYCPQCHDIELTQNLFVSGRGD